MKRLFGILVVAALGSTAEASVYCPAGIPFTMTWDIDKHELKTHSASVTRTYDAVFVPHTTWWEIIASRPDQDRSLRVVGRPGDDTVDLEIRGFNPDGSAGGRLVCTGVPSRGRGIY
jgi:hypothetical protein